jgi:hypothetical protein
MVPHNLATLDGEKWSVRDSGCRGTEKHVLRATWYPGWWLLVSNHLLHPTTNCPTNFPRFLVQCSDTRRHGAGFICANIIPVRMSPTISNSVYSSFQPLVNSLHINVFLVLRCCTFEKCNFLPQTNCFGKSIMALFGLQDWTGNHPTNGAQKCPAKLGRCATRFCSRRLMAVKGPQLGSGE